MIYHNNFVMLATIWY